MNGWTRVARCAAWRDLVREVAVEFLKARKKYAYGDHVVDPAAFTCRMGRVRIWR